MATSGPPAAEDVLPDGPRAGVGPGMMRGVAPLSPHERDVPVHAGVRRSRRWVWLGLLTSLLLTVLDVGGGAATEATVAANLSGAFALAPALTGIGGSPRQVAFVGAVATLLALGLGLADGLPTGSWLVQTAVVAVGAGVAGTVAAARTRQLAQLQDRRQAARTLQAALLTHLPATEGLELVSRYLPASAGDQVGGDWYDAVVAADGATVLVLGDVVGHDVRAAADMGQVRGLLRAYAVEGGQGPARLLARVDESLAGLGLDVLATVVVVRVERGAGPAGERSLVWSSAGHPPPMLVRTDAAGAPAVERLQAKGELLLGVFPETRRSDHTTVLPAGGTLLMSSDGLTERRDRPLAEGLDLLARTLGEVAAAVPTTDALVDEVLARMVGDEHTDDVAVLAARVTASPAA
ncbi:serine phosphatase RsbU (regulator of sigma subunit) [Pseudokineococcus lusitanus]|uniref:Serine phosphatase RsbU (Regulator of sigma subunit) n=1 Tax=Pseudokineococcus lusitanus TaxID=763993 RepID=A0A3N1HQH0_9ACTN|nr:serine phosphatase RsbU (regulator of sigma subunit) [Pseudokineococcus lusitanus]